MLVNASAWACFDKENYDESLPLFQAVVDDRTNRTPGEIADACFGLGRIHLTKGDILLSIQHLIVALKHDKTFHAAYSYLGDIYLSQRSGVPAIENYGHAVAYDPTNMVYRQKLINVVSTMVYKKINPTLKGILTESLEFDELDFTAFGNSWLSFVKADPLIAPLYKLSRHKTFSAFKKGLGALPHINGLIEPFFLMGLGKFVIPDPDFERLCTYLRRYILEAVSEDRSVFSDLEDMDLMSCALLSYCFYTDYVFCVSDEETALVENLRTKVEASDGHALTKLACLGCYVPLGTLKNAAKIAKGLSGGDHVSQIPKTQIEEYLEQQEIKKNIPAMTKILGENSQTVQGQYEEFPYPRWRSCAKDRVNDEIEGHLKGAKANILVAGCGTGKEAVQLAYVFPDAQITAVDLSLTSLAYAIHRVQALGITNIQFMHGDTMQLGEVSERFDYIVSMGGLHHMKDPEAGWKVIMGLLKPQGLMRVALYSGHARWAINDARKVISDKNIGSDANAIRGFRENISQHLKYKPTQNIENFLDYYKLPECRDLLFHVQEHQFDLLQIKSILDEFGLEFLQFYLPQGDIEKYTKRNKDDPDATNLENWAKYEAKNKDLFASIYTFWCKKTA